VGLHRIKEVACPGDVPFRLGIVLGPYRVDVDVVGGVPLTVGSVLGTDSVEGAAELEDDAVRLRRGLGGCLLDEGIDCLVGE